MATEAQRLITAQMLDHPRLAKLGTFEVKSGGGAGSETATFTPGGSQKPVVEGGRQTYEDVTINRVFIPERDQPLIGDLIAARGSYRISVADQPLDAQYNPVQTPATWTGVLTDVNYPDADSESNTSARLVLVIAVDKVAA
jgi:hypothetical protein